MEILITSGGTSEDIDSVRGITNKSTGRLGSIIAEIFAAGGFDVTYLCGETAALPSCENIKVLKIKSVFELSKTLEALLYEKKYDAVIHSMAVSDFTPKALISLDDVVENITLLFNGMDKPCGDISDKIRNVLSECEKPLQEKKISSDKDNIAIILKQTPKVIGLIKSIQPETVLVGFKLLSDVSEDELIAAGRELMEKNSCDFVLVNDLKDISESFHKGILLDKGGILDKADTKAEIGKMILKYVSARIKSR